jgi:ABC-2 type transport system permease protein
MRETMIVMRRELRSYFTSPIAYVFGILFLGTLISISSGALEDGQPADAGALFGLLPFLFLLFLPALTMRLWSEERKLGTLELLMTFPVKVSQLIAGKFLAALAYLALVLLLTVGLPISLDWYGNLDWGPVVAAYLASLLMAGAYVSVGMFWSSLTRDQIVALLLAIVTLGALYFLGWPGFLFVLSASPWVPEWLVGLLGGISPYKYFLSIARGVLDTRDLVYYLCFCGFFLHANALVLQGRRLKG